MNWNLYALATILCWVIFAIIWVGLRNKVKQDINEQTARQKRNALIGFGIYFVLLYWPLLAPNAGGFLYQRSDMTSNIGVALCVLGVAICIWSRFTLGRDWSGGVAIKESHKLVVRGPYQIVRHPIYTGFVSGLAGTAIVMAHFSGYIALLLVLLGLYAKIGQEEKLLTGEFPDDYPAYQKRTKKLIPFIW